MRIRTCITVDGGDKACRVINAMDDDAEYQFDDFVEQLIEEHPAPKAVTISFAVVDDEQPETTAA